METEEKRMLLFSHFLFLKCCTVQIRDSVSFWGPKAFSFGRCDQELRTKCRKMLKNEVAQNGFKIDRLESARRNNSNAANGTQIRCRMQKLFKFKDPPISIKNAKFDFMKNFIKKKIFSRIFWEYSIEYSTEYSGEYSAGSLSSGTTWLARRPPRGPPRRIGKMRLKVFMWQR